MNLADQKCQPARSGLKPLPKEKVEGYLSKLNGWEIKNNSLQCDFIFRNFIDAIRFVNKVFEIVNAEDHYPTIHIFYKTVRIELFTHAINGLCGNDFIVAAKIDRLTKK